MSAMKNCYGDELRVCGSIFPIMSTLDLELENTFLGVLKYQELNPDQENLFRPSIEGLQVNFSQNVNFSP